MRQKAAYHDRLDLFWIAFYCAVGVLAVRLVHIQILRNAYFTEVAERNRTQIIYQNAPRGRIYDRNKVELATSRPAFSLIYLPGKNEDGEMLETLAASLAEELHVEKEDTLGTLRDAQRAQTPVHFENLPMKSMLKLSELKTIFPGVDLIVEARRAYPFGASTGHLLGYMGKIDKETMRRYRDRGYRADSWIGKTGLESLFEDSLRGADGEMRMEVDAHGRLKRRLTLEQSSWSPGGDVHLAIDSRIQLAVEEGLRASPSGQGGAVVLDPRNGDVLALASVPDFDPNVFLMPAWRPERDTLKELPEFNNALSGTYAPGSTFKIITAAALLNDGKVQPQEKVFCPGRFQLGDRTFKCWEKKGHKLQDFLAGLTHSCDVYFYQMGLRAGGAAIERYERLFRIGEKTQIALPGEKGGNLFGPLARRARGKDWYEGDTVNLSIGQGELLVTPIQMAVIIAAVANRGTLWRPHFTQRVEYADGSPAYMQRPEVLGRVELNDTTWDLIQRALENVVEEGTGVAAKIPGITVAGKTGTAQNPHGEDNAWFVAYAGREGEVPSVAVSVLIQHGGHGGSAAAPVARRAIEAAFNIARAPVVPRTPNKPTGADALPRVAPQPNPELPLFPVTR